MVLLSWMRELVIGNYVFQHKNKLLQNAKGSQLKTSFKTSVFWVKESRACLNCFTFGNSFSYIDLYDYYKPILGIKPNLVKCRGKHVLMMNENFNIIFNK